MNQIFQLKILDFSCFQMVKTIDYAGVLKFSAVISLFLYLETKVLALHYKLIWNAEVAD
jgi:hypothetical protein